MWTVYPNALRGLPNAVSRPSTWTTTQQDRRCHQRRDKRRGTDSVIDAVGMEAHGSPIGKLAQQFVGLLPDALCRGPAMA